MRRSAAFHLFLGRDTCSRKPTPLGPVRLAHRLQFDSFMKKTPDEVRALALADPQTAAIAAGIGMKLTQYVDLLVHYATEAVPTQQLFTVPEEALRAAGHDVVSEQTVVGFFQSRLKIDQLVNGTRFEPPAPKGPALR
jgi:hypothetical protein